MAMIYCNPVSTIKKNFEKKIYEEHKWKLYIPSLEFILIFTVGLIMMLSNFVENKNEPEKEKVE